MPAYDFYCQTHGLFEVSYDTMAEAEKIRPCPQCGSDSPRQISALNPTVGTQKGTYGGDYKHAEEIKSAMQDFASGKGNKKNE